MSNATTPDDNGLLVCLSVSPFSRYAQLAKDVCVQLNMFANVQCLSLFTAATGSRQWLKERVDLIHRSALYVPVIGDRWALEEHNVLEFTFVLRSFLRTGAPIILPILAEYLDEATDEATLGTGGGGVGVDSSDSAGPSVASGERSSVTSQAQQQQQQQQPTRNQAERDRRALHCGKSLHRRTLDMVTLIKTMCFYLTTQLGAREIADKMVNFLNQIDMHVDIEAPSVATGRSLSELYVTTLPDGHKPNSGILKVLDREIGHSADKAAHCAFLSFARVYIADLGAITIARAVIPFLPSLETLDLSGNGINNNGVTALCRALVYHPSITSIDLSNNIFSQVGAAELLMLLRGNQRITDLDFADNYINSDVWTRRLNTQLAANRSFMRHAPSILAFASPVPGRSPSQGALLLADAQAHNSAGITNAFGGAASGGRNSSFSRGGGNDDRPPRSGSVLVLPPADANNNDSSNTHPMTASDNNRRSSLDDPLSEGSHPSSEEDLPPESRWNIKVELQSHMRRVEQQQQPQQSSQRSGGGANNKQRSATPQEQQAAAAAASSVWVVGERRLTVAIDIVAMDPHRHAHGPGATGSGASLYGDDFGASAEASPAMQSPMSSSMAFGGSETDVNGGGGAASGELGVVPKRKNVRLFRHVATLPSSNASATTSPALHPQQQQQGGGGGGEAGIQQQQQPPASSSDEAALRHIKDVVADYLERFVDLHKLTFHRLNEKTLQFVLESQSEGIESILLAIKAWLEVAPSAAPLSPTPTPSATNEMGNRQSSGESLVGGDSSMSPDGRYHPPHAGSGSASPPHTTTPSRRHALPRVAIKGLQHAKVRVIQSFVYPRSPSPSTVSPPNGLVGLANPSGSFRKQVRPQDVKEDFFVEGRMSFFELKERLAKSVPQVYRSSDITRCSGNLRDETAGLIALAMSVNTPGSPTFDASSSHAASQTAAADRAVRANAAELQRNDDAIRQSVVSQFGK